VNATLGVRRDPLTGRCAVPAEATIRRTLHAAQAVQVTRKTRDLCSRRWRLVTVYAITNLTHAQASPASLAIAVLSRSGPVNLAAALRYHARDPARPSPPSASLTMDGTKTTERRSPGAGSRWILRVL
jgi:hypothetical protein